MSRLLQILLLSLALASLARASPLPTSIDREHVERSEFETDKDYDHEYDSEHTKRASDFYLAEREAETTPSMEQQHKEEIDLPTGEAEIDIQNAQRDSRDYETHDDYDLHDEEDKREVIPEEIKEDELLERELEEIKERELEEDIEERDVDQVQKERTARMVEPVEGEMMDKDEIFERELMNEQLTEEKLEHPVVIEREFGEMIDTIEGEEIKRTERDVKESEIETDKLEVIEPIVDVDVEITTVQTTTVTEIEKHDEIVLKEPVERVKSTQTDIESLNKPIKGLEEVAEIKVDKEIEKKIKEQAETLLTIQKEAQKEDEKEQKETEEKLPETVIAEEEVKDMKEEDLIAKRVCVGQSEFKYFVPHPMDPTKYVQCDPWGDAIVKVCPIDTIWDSWTLECARPETVANRTIALPAEKPALEHRCNTSEVRCLNGGVCTQADGLYVCVCPRNFTGELCETKVEIEISLFTSIMEGSFSFDKFEDRLEELNMTNSIGFYEKYRDVLDARTFQALMDYLKEYDEDDVRYDTAMTALIEGIMRDIYPDAAYLSRFNASAYPIVDMVRFVPNLLSYAKYSFDRYQLVFSQYQHVLDKLQALLNRTEEELGEKAVLYTRLTNLFLNETMKFLNETGKQDDVRQRMGSYQLSGDQLQTTLSQNYHQTLNSTEELFDMFEQLNYLITEELPKEPIKLGYTLAELKDYPVATRVLNLLNEITVASSQIWNTLINYGFWYITGALAAEH